MDNKPGIKELEDNKAVLRAFVCPELYPFILDEYKLKGKSEETLKSDIKEAREKYKETVDAIKACNMSVLQESKAKQPIEPDTDGKLSKEWGEKALPLVRKVFKDVNKGKGKIRNQYWSGKNKKSNSKGNSGGDRPVDQKVEEIVPENDDGDV